MANLLSGLITKAFGSRPKADTPPIEPAPPDPLEIRAGEILDAGGELAAQLLHLHAELGVVRARAEEAEFIDGRLFWCQRWIANTSKYLHEALYIGLWSKSDDCSDNRNKREALRSASSDIWASRQDLEKIVQAVPAMRKQLKPLIEEIQALETSIEPLSGIVTDEMGKNPDLDYKIGVAEDVANELLPKVTELVEIYQAKLKQAQEEVAAAEDKRRAFLISTVAQQETSPNKTENPAPADAGSGVFHEGR